DSWIQQQFTVPAAGGALSFYVWEFTTDSVRYDWQTCQIRNTSGSTLATVMKEAANGQAWQQKSVSPNNWKGQNVVLWCTVLEDVWTLPTPGGPDDFPRLVRQVASADPSRSLPAAARALWALRWKIGELLGWDDEDDGVGSRVPTLRDRLPAELREAPRGPEFDSLPFTSLYLLEDEWAAETANRTMHGVLHMG